eukprot:8982211-Alexandrium_andersonii.AAC.1
MQQPKAATRRGVRTQLLWASAIGDVCTQLPRAVAHANARATAEGDRSHGCARAAAQGSRSSGLMQLPRG